MTTRFLKSIAIAGIIISKLMASVDNLMETGNSIKTRSMFQYLKSHAPNLLHNTIAKNTHLILTNHKLEPSTKWKYFYSEWVQLPPREKNFVRLWLSQQSLLKVLILRENLEHIKLWIEELTDDDFHFEFSNNKLVYFDYDSPRGLFAEKNVIYWIFSLEEIKDSTIPPL